MVGAVEHARGDDLILADDAVARRLDEFDPALPLALMAGDQRMQRRVEAERRGGRRECRARSPSVIMIAPPTRSGGASESAPRSAANSSRPLGVRFLARGLDDAQIDVAERLEPRLRARRAPCPSGPAARRCPGLPSGRPRRATMSFSGRRFSCTRLGSQRPSSRSAKASARSHAPRDRAPDEHDGDGERQRPPSAISAQGGRSGEKAIDQTLNG